jgi:hypothetical protein
MIISTRTDLQLRLEFFTTVENVGTQSGGTPGIFESVEINTFSQSASVEKFTVIDNNAIKGGYDVENLSPEICSIANWPNVEHVSQGQAFVSVNRTGSAIKTKIPFIFAAVGSEPQAYPSGIVVGSYLEYCDDLLHPLINNTDLYVFEGTPENGNYNELCWAANMDFSGVSIWNSRSGTTALKTERAATLITRRHAVMAWHYRLYVGDVVKFSDGTNIYERTIVGTTRDTGINGVFNSNPVIKDRCVAVLNADLPETITSYPLLGDWFFKEISPTSTYYAYAGVYLNKNRQAGIIWSPQTAYSFSGTESGYVSGSPVSTAYATVALNRITSSTYTNNPESAFCGRYESHAAPVISGTSGCPVFVPVTGGLALLTTFTSVMTGPRWDESITNLLITDADADALARGSLLAPTGYTVTVAPDPTL